MEQRSVDFLRRLLDAPGPSGYERAPARIWRAEVEDFADEVDHDVTGNSYASVRGRANGAARWKVIVAGHIDEIGFVVTHIDPEGFLWFAPIGGWDDQVVVGQRIRIAGRDGDVIGVIEPGDYFGELSLLSNSQHSKTATAEHDCEILVLPKRSFEALLEVDEDLAAQVRNKRGPEMQAARS